MRYEKEYTEISYMPASNRKWSIILTAHEHIGNLSFFDNLVRELIQDAANFEPPIEVPESEVEIFTNSQGRLTASYTAMGNPPAVVTEEYSITRRTGKIFSNGPESKTISAGSIFRNRKKPEEDAKEYKNKVSKQTAIMRRKARDLAWQKNRENWSIDIDGRNSLHILTADDMLNDI